MGATDALAGAKARAELAERLRDRLPEIERAALARLRGVSDAPGRPDPDYAEGLRVAAGAALAYFLDGVEHGEDHVSHPPTAVLVQARTAARNRVGLDIVLRRCFAGYSLFGDFLIGELERFAKDGTELSKYLLRTQATLFDRLLAAVTEEYTREAERLEAARSRRPAQLIDRLLAGEPVDAVDLGYDLDACHLGVVASGAGASTTIRDLAKGLDQRLLLLERDSETVWAWLGSRRSIEAEEVVRRLSATRPPQVRLALGEPGEGLHGWGLTHRQAAVALPVAMRTEPVVRYADVALLASVLQDDLLIASLRRMYLDPLVDGSEANQPLCETVRAYFAAERHLSSAAANLGVTRQTVAKRLRVAEKRLNRTLASCETELRCALLLQQFD